MQSLQNRNPLRHVFMKYLQGLIDLAQDFSLKPENIHFDFGPTRNKFHCQIGTEDQSPFRHHSGPDEPTQDKRAEAQPSSPRPPPCRLLPRSPWSGGAHRTSSTVPTTSSLTLERRRAPHRTLELERPYAGEPPLPDPTAPPAPSRRGRPLHQTAPAPGQRRVSRPCPAPDRRALRPRPTAPLLLRQAATRPASCSCTRCRCHALRFVDYRFPSNLMSCAAISSWICQVPDGRRARTARTSQHSQQKSPCPA
jgi:hypothetical protein